jgi:hypothetical protein
MEMHEKKDKIMPWIIGKILWRVETGNGERRLKAHRALKTLTNGAREGFREIYLKYIVPMDNWKNCRWIWRVKRGEWHLKAFGG